MAKLLQPDPELLAIIAALGVFKAHSIPATQRAAMRRFFGPQAISAEPRGGEAHPNGAGMDKQQVKKSFNASEEGLMS